MGKRKPVPTPEGHQQCHQCLAIKPHADFEPCDWRPVGIKATCRPCLVSDREVAAYLRRIHAEGYLRQCAGVTPQPSLPALNALLSSDVDLEGSA